MTPGWLTRSIIATVATMGQTLFEVYSDVGAKLIEARG